jgi:release factor glutamine methyltransferase
MTIDLGPALNEAQRALSAQSETPFVDSLALLAGLTGRSTAWVLAHPDARLAPDQAAALNASLERLASGEPLPYVLGRREFFGLEFEIGPGVLIPRPETELLVEQALGWLVDHPNRRTFIDVGTGSGCIAVSLAARVHDLHGLAVDISAEALSLARRNLARHGVGERVALVQGDLATAVGRSLDLIVANLPYVPTETLKKLRVSAYEPLLALDGGSDGLAQIRRLLAEGPRVLAHGGLLLMEIEAGQGQAALRLAEDIFPGAALEVLKDLAGKDRLLKVMDRGD